MKEYSPEKIGKLMKEHEDRLSVGVEELNKPKPLVMWAIVAFSLFIGVLSLFSGITKDWAWEVGKVLLTIDGLIIGFVILGFTFVLTKDFTGSIIDYMIKDSKKELDEKLAECIKNPEINQEEFLETEPFIAVTKPIFKMRLMLNGLKTSFTFLAISIAFAFILFGVGEQTAMYSAIFLFPYVLSIFFLLSGTYSIFKTIEAFAEQAVNAGFLQLYSAFVEELKKKKDEK